MDITGTSTNSYTRSAIPDVEEITPNLKSTVVDIASSESDEEAVHDVTAMEVDPPAKSSNARTTSEEHGENPPPNTSSSSGIVGTTSGDPADKRIPLSALPAVETENRPTGVPESTTDPNSISTGNN